MTWYGELLPFVYSKSDNIVYNSGVHNLELVKPSFEHKKMGIKYFTIQLL